MTKRNLARAIHLLEPEQRKGFSTCCPAPPVYAVLITFETRDRNHTKQLRTAIRRFCAKHGANYASKHQLQLPVKKTASEG